MTRVIVVGGGIAGLTTALTLAGGDVPDLAVEVWEADDRLGGKLLTTPFAGLPAVDEGSDAFLARVPAARELAAEVGLGDDLTSPAAARAAVWYDGLHPIPDGLLLGVPTGLAGLATSRLLSLRGKLRAAVEPLLPRTATTDDVVGALIRRRFGDEVQERLVDALVGSIYAADTDRMSFTGVPQLAALTADRSLLLGARRRRAAAPTDGGPIFLAPRSGMGSLVAAVADAAVARGVVIRRGQPLTELARDGATWRADGESADVVVLATPAAPTAPILSPVAPEAGRLLATMEHAGVVLVTLHVPEWPDRLHGRSGYLVPKPVQGRVTAASFGSQKWAHWRPPSGGEVLRVSLGRDGAPVDDLHDEQAVTAAVEEVSRHLRLRPAADRGAGQPVARRLPPVPAGPRRVAVAGGGQPPPRGPRRRGELLGRRRPGVHRRRPHDRRSPAHRAGDDGPPPRPVIGVPPGDNGWHTCSMRRTAALIGAFVALAVLAGACSGGDEPSTADADRLRTALLDAAHDADDATTTDVADPSSTARTRAGRAGSIETLPAFEEREPAGRRAGTVPATSTASALPTSPPESTMPAPTTPATTTPATTTPVTTAAPTIAPDTTPVTAPPGVGAGEPRIEIPALGLTRPLFEGIELDTLDLGPGHWPGTALPGQPGNAVIAGHRVSHNADFRDIDRLVPGDEVVFTTYDGRFTYRVLRTEIVAPEAMWIIDQGTANTATLFACHPPGSIRERIVVHLEQIA